MYLPPIRAASCGDIYVSGDVTIHGSAVVALGTILQAAPGCRIVIGEGAYIGMGTILNAWGGNIEVQAGAILGAGVLAVGSATIGQNACVGTATTIFNAAIAGMAVVPAGSLIGDDSRQVPLPPPVESQAVSIPLPPPEPASAVTDNGEGVAAPPPSEQPNSPVVGQAYIKELLFTLFPERQA